MKSEKNVTINPAESNPAPPEVPPCTPKAKSRLRTYKRKQRRLKATIRRLREELARSEAVGWKYLRLYIDERSRAEQYMAAIVEAKELMYKAHDYAFKSFQEANQALIKLTESQCSPHKQQTRKPAYPV